MRFAVSIMLGCVASFAIAGCASRNPGPAPSPSLSPRPTALPSVAPAPSQTRPAWIASVSPRGEAADGAQIRVRFVNDVVPVEALDSPDRSGVLAHVRVEPELPGRFIVLTPRMIAFQADRPIPHAARVRVTLAAGLADRAGHVLASDFVWSFTTAPLVLSGITGADAIDPAKLPARGRRPIVGIDASDPVDVASLVARARLVDPRDAAKTVALEVAPSPSPDPSGPASGDAAGPDRTDASVHYDLRPVSDLAYDATYDVRVDAGVLPLAGNVPAAAPAPGRLRTYGPLRLRGVAYGDPADGSRFANGAPSLTFTNDVTPQSAARALTLSPAPNPALTLVRVDEGGSLAIDADALTPRTTYAARVAPTLTDAFGQTLGSAVSATFRTGDLTPNLWAPTGLSIFPVGLPLALDVATTNLPEGGYRSAFRRLTPADLVAHDVSGDDGPSALLPPDPAAWPPHAIAQSPIRESQTGVALRAQLGGATGMLAYGFSARTVRVKNAAGAFEWVEPKLYGTVQITDVGVFAQWFPHGGFVRANRLTDGAPLVGARVDVYESLTGTPQKAAAPGEPCATGTTGPGGVWTVSGSAFDACAGLARTADGAPPLLAIVSAGGDWSFVRTGTYGSYYGGRGGSGIYEGWSAGAPTSRGTILSDRSLYQPGETAKFVGVAYFERDGTIGRGTSPSYAVTATSPSGAKLPLGTATPDAFGAFALSHAFGARAEVGDWSLSAVGTGGEEIDGSFRVAQFKPPNFSVDLTLGASLVAGGAMVSATSKSAYLFGAPVDGGVSHVAVTRAREFFTPHGWDAYVFGRAWSYPEQEPAVTSDVLQRDVSIDATGIALAPVPVATDLPYAMRYTVSAETTDASHLAVADTKSFVALPSDAEIGLRGDFVATAGTPFPVDVVVTDPSGATRGDREVRLVLQRRVDASATQIVEGGEAARDAVRYVDVATKDLPGKSGSQRLSFTAAQPGEYRVRANVAGAADDATATDLGVWVAGAGTADWFRGDDSGVTVKLDKSTYRPGDRATAIVESPYPEADLYFAVVRHGVMYATTRTVRGGAPRISFAVTPEMLPNAAVEAVLVRRGPSLAKVATANVGRLSRIGFAPFDVAIDAKYVRVTVSPEHPRLEPATRQHVALRLRDRDGKPVRGEVAVAVVNDAILQLSGYRFPDLAAMVYADEPISMRTGDNRGDVKLVSQRPSVEKGFGFGGGAMAGPAGTRVREKFVPLAYWNPALRTDAWGDAAIDFALPDDLTTWRIMALALTPDARFGNGEATFVSTKALATNPIVPQFVRPGDVFSAGVSVTSVGAATGDVAVDATLAGGATFASGDAHRARATGAQTAPTAAYRFDAVAAGTQDLRLNVATRRGQTTDAFSVAVPLVRDDAFESVVATGTTTGMASVPLDVAPSLRGPLGGLDVTLASTLLADVVEPARALALPQPPFATTLASRIAVAADSIVLGRRYGSTAADATLRRSATADLDALRALALPDGGFGAWPGATASEPYTTAFVLQQLHQGVVARIVPETDLNAGLRYLRGVLANPPDSAGCGRDAACLAEVRLEAAETLAALGDPRNDFVSDMLAHEAHFGYYERVELARFLLKLPDWKSRGLALRDTLFQNVSLGARHASVDVPGTFGESDVAGQAQMLGLALDGGTDASDVDRLLESLLGMRRDGRWGCVCDDAEAMNALASYAARDAKPPHFSATASVPASPERTLQADFNGFTAPPLHASVALDALARGPGSVRFAKHGDGTLHYVVALRYPVADRAAGAYAGLRIDRILRRASLGEPLGSFGLALPAVPTTVSAGRVYDVEDRIVTDHPVSELVVTDPLPAGFEAIDASFRTSAPTDPGGGDALALDYRAIYRDRVLSFAHRLEPGSYAMHYLVRSVTPGTFAWPGARVALLYEPEEFGRTASTQLVVTP